MNITHKLGAAALTATLVIGGGAAAFAGGNGGGDGPSGDRAAVLCAHQDQIIPHLTTRQSNLTTRIAKLTDAQAKATAAGKTNVAERIGKRIDHLNHALTRVSDRLVKAPAWIAEHCTTVTPAPGS